MRDLKRFLDSHNIDTVLLDGCLSYDDKVHVFFDKNESGRMALNFQGSLCMEYFQIRRLVNEHFGRL